MKPDWAKYSAQDEDGTSYYWEVKPVAGDGEWVDGPGREGRVAYAAPGARNAAWDQTLERLA